MHAYIDVTIRYRDYEWEQSNNNDVFVKFEKKMLTKKQNSMRYVSLIYSSLSVLLHMGKQQI